MPRLQLPVEWIRWGGRLGEARRWGACPACARPGFDPQQDEWERYGEECVVKQKWSGSTCRSQVVGTWVLALEFLTLLCI